MTVKELIKELEKAKEDDIVYIYDGEWAEPFEIDHVDITDFGVIIDGPEGYQ